MYEHSRPTVYRYRGDPATQYPAGARWYVYADGQVSYAPHGPGDERYPSAHSAADLAGTGRASFFERVSDNDGSVACWAGPSNHRAR